MAHIASELASKCAISSEAARNGLGIILTLLKSKLPEESFAKVSEAVPEADSLMAAVGEKGEEESGGVLGAFKGTIGKILGGGTTDMLLSKFGRLGISADQIEKFLPSVIEFLRSKLPESVMNQISGLLPIPHESPH